jgi:type I site-specific restriction endonuclease
MAEEKVWDPLRRKEVALTPEEEVREWFSGVLRDGMKVPAHMMMSEVSLKVGRKPYRADIVVYDREGKPLMVVECKRPDIVLDQAVVDQAIRYNRALDVRYIAVTNGPKTFLFVREGDGFVFMEKAPLWEEMICKR